MLALQLGIVFGALLFPVLVILFISWGEPPESTGGDLYDSYLDEIDYIQTEESNHV